MFSIRVRTNSGTFFTRDFPISYLKNSYLGSYCLGKFIDLVSLLGFGVHAWWWVNAGYLHPYLGMAKPLNKKKMHIYIYNKNGDSILFKGIQKIEFCIKANMDIFFISKPSPHKILM